MSSLHCGRLHYIALLALANRFQQQQQQRVCYSRPGARCFYYDARVQHVPTIVRNRAGRKHKQERGSWTWPSEPKVNGYRNVIYYTQGRAGGWMREQDIDPFDLSLRRNVVVWELGNFLIPHLPICSSLLRISRPHALYEFIYITRIALTRPTLECTPFKTLSFVSSINPL